MKKYYPLMRALHLYVGLFISPFVLIFCISALAFNHAGYVNRVNPIQPLPETYTRLDKTPYDTTDLLTAKAIIGKLGIQGEIDFISKNEDKISFPVHAPGLTTNIQVNRHTDSVRITQQKEGSVRAMNYLHMMPGQHNASIRGNSLFLKVWKVMADTVVYALLFLTVSGILLWLFLKVERKMGVYAIALGVLFFAGLLAIIF